MPELKHPVLLEKAEKKWEEKAIFPPTLLFIKQSCR